MKCIILPVVVGLSFLRMYAAESEVLSTSPNGAFELVAVKHADFEQYILRETKTKKSITVPDGNIDDDFINPDFGSPSIDWSPNSGMFIVTAKLYRGHGKFTAVFRISAELKLIRVALPDDALPARWNSDNSLVLLVRREEVYKFDPTREIIVPSEDKNLKESPRKNSEANRVPAR